MVSMEKEGKTLALLVASTFVYALNGTFEYILIRSFNLYLFFFIWSLGSMLSLPIIIRAMKMRNDLFSNLRRHLPSIVGGVLLVVFNLSLFMAFKIYYLAGVYPLIATSSLIFFGIDVARYKRRLSKREIGIVTLGIMLVIIGVYLAESNGSLSFDFATLPFVIVIMLFAGFGYYLVCYNMRKYSVGSKISSISISSFVASLFILFFAPAGAFAKTSPVLALGVLAAGAFYIIAVALELRAVEINENRKLYKSVVLKNFINNFTYLDTVLVLLFSVAIGSFSSIEIAGGLLIVVGVLVIALAKGE
jgi:drug/metabolite transporter (DMT)-like permease